MSKFGAGALFEAHRFTTLAAAVFFFTPRGIASSPPTSPPTSSGRLPSISFSVLECLTRFFFSAKKFLAGFSEILNCRALGTGWDGSSRMAGGRGGA